MNDVNTKPKSWISILTLGIAIVALGLSLVTTLYFYYHASSWQASFSANSTAQSTLEKQAKHARRDITALTTTVQQVSGVNTALSTQVTNLQAQLDTLQNQLQTKKAQLGLEHVLYLLQLAQDSLLYEFDNTKALLFLQEAHQELSQNTDAEVQAIDTTLQQDITALKNIPPLNPAKIIAQLTALQDAVTTLPLTQTEPQTIPQNNENPQSFWHRFWGHAWHNLQKVITIKHYAADAPHFITPDERAYLNARLCLYLSQAQWAVLSHDNTLFTTSLKQANLWLQTHYDTNNAIAESIQKQINTLTKINLQPGFPEMSPLIDRIQTILTNSEG